MLRCDSKFTLETVVQWRFGRGPY